MNDNCERFCEKQILNLSLRCISTYGLNPGIQKKDHRLNSGYFNNIERNWKEEMEGMGINSLDKICFFQ